MLDKLLRMFDELLWMLEVVVGKCGVFCGYVGC